MINIGKVVLPTNKLLIWHNLSDKFFWPFAGYDIKPGIEGNRETRLSEKSFVLFSQYPPDEKTHVIIFEL